MSILMDTLFLKICLHLCLIWLIFTTLMIDSMFWLTAKRTCGRHGAQTADCWLIEKVQCSQEAQGNQSVSHLDSHSILYLVSQPNSLSLCQIQSVSQSNQSGQSQSASHSVMYLVSQIANQCVKVGQPVNMTDSVSQSNQSGQSINQSSPSEPSMIAES